MHSVHGILLNENELVLYNVKLSLDFEHPF